MVKEDNKKAKTLDTIHIKIHALRMIPNYVPTKSEWDISKIISDNYSDECDECKNTSERMKHIQFSEKKSFLGGIFK